MLRNFGGDYSALMFAARITFLLLCFAGSQSRRMTQPAPFPQVGEASPHPRVSEGCVDLVVKLFDHFDWRVPARS